MFLHEHRISVNDKITIKQTSITEELLCKAALNV